MTSLANKNKFTKRNVTKANAILSAAEMKTGRLPCLWLVAVLALTSSAQVRLGENVLLNSGFTAMDGAAPQYWDAGKKGDVVVSANALEPGAMPAVTLLGRPDNRGFDLRQYGLRLMAGGRYRLSCKVRATDFRPEGVHGFKVANDKWHWAEGFDLPTGTYDWTPLVKDFVSAPSQGNKYFVVLYSSKAFAGKLEVADARLVALDEETSRGTSPSELAAVMTMPRLVPWAPLLDEIPAERPIVAFRFFGSLPSGSFGDYEVRVTCGDAACVMPLAETAFDVCLPEPAATGTFTASVVRRADGESVFARTYAYRLRPAGLVPSAGRKLNNLVTEYVNEPLAAGASVTRRLTLGRRGWVMVSAAAQVSIDGTPVIGPDTPRHETFRELEAGEHLIGVTDAAGGSFVVRGIPELFNYCTFPSVVPENPPFDWPFVEKYVLPGVTTLNGGKIAPRDRPSLKARGYLWLGNQNSRNISDDDDLCRRLATSRRINDACYDGVTCDEQYLNQPDVISHYSAGLWKYVHPEGKRVYSWVVGKPAIAGVDHDFVAASANATGGSGKLLTEYYCATRATEAEARAYVEDWIKGSLADYDAFSPAYRPHYGVIFGNYTQSPNISLWGHSEVDYRYYLDLQFNLVANDPAFADIGCTGVWGSYYAEEEIHRWTFMLMRHYFVEGRREMLSAKYGFKYVSGHLTNGDFARGLEGWRTSGDVDTGSLKSLGLLSEGRRSGNDGCGDTYARLTQIGETPATVTQRVTGLVPGRDYCLRYAVLDAKEVASDIRGEPREYALKAVLPEGFAVRNDLSWSHVDNRKSVKGSDHAPRANMRHVVFTAAAAEMDLVFTTAAARDGESFALNCVSIHPYLPR